MTDIIHSASTRKEEIARFSKASKDPEFARVVKARTLGPDHLETQSQLRRGIRVIPVLKFEPAAALIGTHRPLVVGYSSWKSTFSDRRRSLPA